MLIFTTRLSRKKAACAVIIAGVLTAAVIILVSCLQSGGERARPQVADNSQRIAYLQSLGWEVESEPLETLQFLLPDALEEPYLTYNELQKEQGFDLTACCGRQVTRYTYAVTNYPGRAEGVQLNLYVCEDLPVAGDVCCPGADGFQKTLEFPEEA